MQFILQHTGMKSLVCTRRQLAKVCEAAPQCPAFTTAILVDGVTPEAAKAAQAANIQVVSFAKVEALGAETIATTGHKHSPPSSEDIASFSYTSGTTGAPKGALLTHGNLISAMCGLQVFDDMKINITDRHLSYLPLAHIFERCVIEQVLLAGGSVAFFRGDPIFLIEDLQACCPTILPVAPRVLNKIYDKVRVDYLCVWITNVPMFSIAWCCVIEISN